MIKKSGSCCYWYEADSVESQEFLAAVKQLAKDNDYQVKKDRARYKLLKEGMKDISVFMPSESYVGVGVYYGGNTDGYAFKKVIGGEKRDFNKEDYSVILKLIESFLNQPNRESYVEKEINLATDNIQS